jgi:hypothetical protein
MLARDACEEVKFQISFYFPHAVSQTCFRVILNAVINLLTKFGNL